jgi:hypothetical protein
MTSPSINPPAVHWHTPPFFKLVTPSVPGASRACALELNDGRKWRAELVDFHVGASTVGLHQADPKALRRIDLKEIKSIKLTRPVAYVRDTVTLGAIGVPDPSADNRKPFVVVFNDGTKMTGNTLGFVKDKESLFLFLSEADGSAVGCDACRDGYRGRIVVYELLPGTQQIKHLARTHATVPQLLSAARESGMLSLRQNAIGRLLQGVLDLPSARAVSS